LELVVAALVVQQAHHSPSSLGCAPGFAVGVMVLLMVISVGYLPIRLATVSPVVTVYPWQIARPRPAHVAPFAAGLAETQYEISPEAKRVPDWIRNVSLILRVLLDAAVNIDRFYRSSAHWDSGRPWFTHLGWGLVGCLADLTLTPGASWLLAPASATSPPHLW
jgi:hypothetical protein